MCSLNTAHFAHQTSAEPAKLTTTAAPGTTYSPSKPARGSRHKGKKMNRNREDSAAKPLDDAAPAAVGASPLGTAPAASGHTVSTAVHECARQGFADVMEVLIKHNADVNATNEDGSTPLTVAMEEGQHEVVALLLRHGAVATKDADADGLDRRPPPSLITQGLA